MKKMKKLIVFCTLMLVLSLCFSAAASAADSYVMLYGFVFDINADGKAVIYDYDDRSADVVIPAALFADVVGIADYAFFDDTAITSVSFDRATGLQRIGSGAFHGCTGLTALTIPGGVELGFGSFMNCASLRSVSIGEGTTLIPAQSFYGCGRLSDVTLPETVVEIGDYAFNGCASLDSITIPAAVTTIGEDAFDGCSWLTIYGSTGSEAERYADEHGIPFIDPDAAPEVPLIRGDADGDGKVTILDATCVQRRLASLTTGRYNALAADADGDGGVTILDATRIQRWLAGFSTYAGIGQPIG